MKITSDEISISILKTNDAIAKELNEYFNENKIFTVNLLSSPGSGKTTLLESFSLFFDKEKICILVGDVETERDAKRLREKGLKSFQIITGGACHLEAVMIKQFLNLVPHSIDYLFIENVGNLVCPASYNLGEHLRLVMLSTPEGDDKILKYPKVFLSANALIINKKDLLPYLLFDIEKIEEEANKIEKNTQIFLISALKNEGVEKIAEFIKEERRKKYG